MNRMAAIAALLLAVLPSDAQLAKADYHRRGDPYSRYVTLSPLPEKERATAAAAIKFAVPSASKELILDHQIPERVGQSDVYRIDLQRLGWNWQDYAKVLKKYPYGDAYNPLVIRADWLIAELADATRSQAYGLLLYGEKSVPKDLAQFEKFWGIDRKRQDGLSFGWIERRSQVSKVGTRWIEHLERDGGSYWVTKDVLKLDRKSDPLDAPDGNFKFDGREAIVLIPKVSLKSGMRGGLQVYGLFDAQNKSVNEAPTALVEDYGRTIRNNAAIILSASCATCHVRGMNPPSVNGLKSLIVKGVELKTYEKDAQEAIESFHLTDSGKQLGRDSEDYVQAVLACNGLAPEANAAAYKATLDNYFADVTPERAAGELYCTVDELKNAVAYASAHKLELGVRVVGLAHGEPIPRDTFASEYLRLTVYLKTWRAQ